MNVTRTVRFVTHLVAVLVVLNVLTVALAGSLAGTLAAQNPPPPAGGRGGDPNAPPAVRIVATPASLTIKAMETVPLKVAGYDAQGNVTNYPLQVVGPRNVVFYNQQDGTVRVTQAGNYTVTVTAGGRGVVQTGRAPVTLEIPVKVSWPALTRIAIEVEPGRLYTDVKMAHTAHGFHADSSERVPMTFTWKSSNPEVATVDKFGGVSGIKPGSVTITAAADNISASVKYTVAANPVKTVELGITESTIRTGDVIHLNATARRADGSAVPDAPITWSYSYTPDDSLVAGGVQGGPGIVRFGRFAANYPGRYEIMAQIGSAHARTTVQATPRDVRQKITIMSRGGTVHSTHTSDLWPWTGKDGRDYCLVGTWGGDGYGLVFDITDMGNVFRTDSIKIDARTINDVTVSPDGRYGVLAREGASNRINGVVILDLANPAHPKIASEFSQELTGGVHNMFATNDYLFAVSAGTKYVIIDVKDIYHPKYVSEYRHPNARLHDLWVNNGIAYSAQGGAGTVVVDVGNGKYGGSIEHPKLITVYNVRSGHEIFPYFQQKTGKVYLFIGDEEMNRSTRTWGGSGYQLNGPDGKPPKNSIAQNSGGYTHIIDFTDPMQPIPVARYWLEDYGSHDIIVKDDILYQAYYDGGVRLVDVSGELMGNLYDQGREIAVFKSYDPDGYTANAPFVMNAMPWKGKVLWTDFNSGLWSAKLEPKPVVP